MNGHTKEPWAYDPDARNFGQPFTLQPVGANFRMLMSMEDFERACTCVNACAGIPTEALKGGVLGEIGKTLMEAEAGLEVAIATISAHTGASWDRSSPRLALQIVRDILTKLGKEGA